MTDVLTGEASADDVNAGEIVFSDSSDVFMLRHLGEVFLEYGSRKRINLNLPGGVNSCLFKALIKSADSRKKAAVGQSSLWL